MRPDGAARRCAIRNSRDGITRKFVFASFVEAFGFMVQVAILAEKADHRPERSNVYSRVEILLTTHDADGLSMRDILFARAIEVSCQVDARSGLGARKLAELGPARNKAKTRPMTMGIGGMTRVVNSCPGTIRF